MEEKLKEAIKSCAEKATDAKTPDEALKFTQAALNASHALATLKLNNLG